MKRLRALAVSLLLLAPPGLPSPAVVAGSLAVGVVLGAPHDAEARSRSSGGYSRPSGGFRTPSLGSRSYGAPSRTPSTSGGYGRPSGGGIFGGGSSSAGDRALSRQQSGSALDSYRSRQAPSAPPAGMPPTGSRDDWSGGGIRIPRQGGSYGYPPSYGGGGSIFGGGGLGQIAMMWLLFQSLNRPGYADYFHHHQNDPAYREWRAEADQKALGDPDLKAKLDRLDAQLDAEKAKPVDPGYVPPNPPRPDTRTPGVGSGMGSMTMLLVLLMAGGFILLMWQRRKKGSPSMAVRPSSPWGTATEIIRGKVTGETYRHKTFRVGMTLPVDPTPFILAAGTKVPQPNFGGNNLLNVMAVGELDGPGQGDLTRLYVDEQGFFQLHLNAAGLPDECRYFGRIDEVHPADADEWSFWLDPKEGMIGWPEFQTKDGKTYARAWLPGGSRIEPTKFSETLTDVNGSRPVEKTMMLYQAPSGAAAPAPETEYILVTAVDAGGQAWVEVCAGIDVNPASLSLA